MLRIFLAIGVLSLIVAHSHVVAAQTSAGARSQTEVKNRNQPGTADTPSTDASADTVENAIRFYQQGLDLVEAGQLPEAVRSFRQALKLDPEYAAAYAALGRTYFKMREWQQASDNLKRAAALNSKQREANKVNVDTHVTTQQKQPGGPTLDSSPELSANNSLVSTNETTAATINLKQLLPPLPEPPAQTESITTPAAPVNNNEDQSSTEQTALGTRVSDPVTAPSVNDTNSTNTVARREESSPTKIYRVGPNDVLDIRLNDASGQKSTLYTVTAAGLLEHPLLSEPMSVAGLSVEEIGSRIEADLQKRAIIENAKAIVGVRDYASHTVIVSGLVKDSGSKILRREAIPLYVVVADAQPLPEAAKVVVVRGGEANEIHTIDLNQPADMNFLVRSGDVINVRPGATQFIYIGGEIKFPGEKKFRRGLTLMQVILASGGIDPKAKLAEIARGDDKGFLVPTRFKLKEIVAGKAVDPLLEPGDRISILR